MANNPKKVKDPTEVALSAIQEALNIGENSAEPDLDVTGTSSGDGAPPVIPSAATPFPEAPFETRPSSERWVFEPIEEQRGPRRAANDDREAIGQLLQALQKGSPARNVYTFASIFTGVWLVGCGLLTVTFLSSLQAAI